MRLLSAFVSFTLILTSLSVNAQTDASRQWPQFRGHLGSGILDNASLPVSWNVDTQENILWNIPIPGLAHSCPIIWNDRIFITTAVSSSQADSLKIGLYGDIDMADDQSIHEFRVLCLDRKSGKILWNQLADKGVPKERRHTKSTYANPTPATDGQLVVVSFGSHGLYCYDFKGNLIWKKDLGSLATGPYNEVGVEWGYASSPVIHKGKVIIQADLLKGSFLALYDLKTGEETWRIPRNQAWEFQKEEVSSWGSPAIYEGNGKTHIILNGYPYMQAYEFETGKEVWRFGNVGDAPAPTAVVAHNLIYLNSAHGKWSPIVAIRPESSGDITLTGDTVTRSENVAWNFKRGGAYMASLLVYGNKLYNLQISGLLTVLDAVSGKVLYKQNIGKAFSASPVAADGKIYLTAETGEVYVIGDGPEYKLVAENHMKDPCMATPAIAPGMLVLRTQHRLIAVGSR